MSEHSHHNGWTSTAREDPAVMDLQRRLSSYNGIFGLEIIPATDLERIVTLFRRDGFVVVENVLSDEQTALLADGCNEVVDEILALDPQHKGNRGELRYSFGGCSLTRSQLHRPAWQMLLELPVLTPLLTAIFGSPNYALRAASGDFCLPGATKYQRLHSDVRDWTSNEESPFSAFHDPSRPDDNKRSSLPLCLR